MSANLVDLGTESVEQGMYVRGGLKLQHLFNSFTANVADRRRHRRLPTSPNGDLDPLPLPCLSPFVYIHYVVFKVLLTLILQI